jgi:hypothetical protein
MTTYLKHFKAEAYLLCTLVQVLKTNGYRFNEGLLIKK